MEAAGSAGRGRMLAAAAVMTVMVAAGRMTGTVVRRVRMDLVFSRRRNRVLGSSHLLLPGRVQPYQARWGSSSVMKL